MRYFVQFAIPILIFAVVVYALTRGRGQGSAATAEDGSGPRGDTGPFIVILVVSAIVALTTAYLLHLMWGE